MQPKVSVIIPVYNVKEYLERCLNSLRNQSLKELEIICVNDGSTDESLNILNNYAEVDTRIIVINRQNEGVSSARNYGLTKATGEFIGFVDADDSIEKDFYKLLYENVKKYNADIACGEVRRPDSLRKKDIKNLVHNGIRTAEKTEDKYKLCKIPERCFIWNKIYNREKLLSAGITFPLDITYEDMLWSHAVVDKLGKLVVVPKAIYNYYWNYGRTMYRTNVKCGKQVFAEVLNSCVEYAFENKINIQNYKKYTPLKRLRVNFLGIRIFDCRIWKCVKVFYILGIEAFRIYVNDYSS